MITWNPRRGIPFLYTNRQYGGDGMDKREKLALLSVMHGGNWSAIADSLRRKETPDRSVIRDAYITIYDDMYPASLRELRFPPWVLFYKGDISLLQAPAVAVVGSREAIDYGRLAAEWVVENLCDRYTVVSGLARGIDAAAHRTALRLGGRTIGVIGSGLGTSYPRENISLYRDIGKENLIITEYPHDVGVRKEHFPWRNRIIAALGRHVFVIQAARRSGTMLTVNEALTLNRDIYCIPYPLGNPFGEGCNHLIAQGAMILYKTEQLQDLCAGTCQKTKL